MTFRTTVCLLLISVLSLSFCGDGGVRKYTERQSPPTAGSGTTAVAKSESPAAGMASHFQWQVPEGWSESRTPSGFRLATFTISEKEKEAVCTIIPLAGDAGGPRANVERWLGQVTGSEADKATVDQLMKNQNKFLTKGQMPAVMVDFVPVTPPNVDSSIMVTTITVDKSSVFIKITGDKNLLDKHREKFKTLCQSFSMAPHASGHGE